MSTWEHPDGAVYERGYRDGAKAMRALMLQWIAHERLDATRCQEDETYNQAIEDALRAASGAAA